MNDNGEPTFEINDTGNFIRVTAIRLMYPDAEMSWDRNWIESHIEISAAPFHGKYRASLMTVDFEKFKRELRRVYKDLSGVTAFNCLEDDIEIKIKGDGLGHFAATCTGKDTTNIHGSKLSFHLDFDQTQIPELINQLDEITKAFPIFGDDIKMKNE